MATRELKLKWEPVVCEICQRSLLRGEYSATYYDGDRVHEVCDLCTARAHRQGWIREGTSVAELAPGGHAERARSLVSRLRGRRETGSSRAEAPAAARASLASAMGSPRTEEDPAGERVELADDLPHHVRAVPSAAGAQVARALVLFNATEHARTVAGVIRSLGAPYVYAASGGLDVLVDVIVVWELCWYRYEVDLENEVVRLHGQGYEPAEIGRDLPPANAIADERGKLSLAGN
jgi:hypothetical protein